MTTVLLGPQRRPSLRPVMRSLALTGPVAVVNAGWRHREDEDDELLELLDGRGVNLSLYRRWLDIAHHEPELSAWEADRQEALDELSGVYALRLHHASEVVHELQRRTKPLEEAGSIEVAGTLEEAAPVDTAVDAALGDALDELRRLDAWHLVEVARLRARFADRVLRDEPERLRRHRDRVAELLEPTEVVVVAGGHVGVLLDCLRLFDVDLGDRAIVAWSAGAMALAERIVLYHDFAPQGNAHPEVHDVGLGVLPGVVPMPHARRRLHLDDETRISVLVRRLEPARCLVLDDGVRVDLGPAGELPPGARVLAPDGHVRRIEDVAA